MPQLKQACQAEVWTTPEVLALVNPDDASLAEARKTEDGAGLVRWAVAVFRTGDGAADLEASPVGDPTTIARAFRAAIREYELQREAGVLRGSLWTIGRRIVHDLRTPLGSIATGAEALNEKMAECCPEDCSLARSIIESSESMGNLLKRTSFLARACGTTATKRVFNMGTAFWTAFQLLEGRILNQRATLLQPQIWPDISGVESWVEVIWWNLLSNALSHAGDAPKIEVGWEKAENGYRFWLRDNGSGVPFEKQKTLFFPFHRLHEPSAPQGLGLPTIQCLVESQGGLCGYEPVEGRGANFFFVLSLDVPEVALTEKLEAANVGS
ncbi:MAG TPA: HAMP domain-containing sensor histidine kinase [Candidatus Limnocylindria bacterium]|nr:HAMP domain-containing sensor histidine kinase [Candidatus Limnocylindria bacterium]